MMWLSFGKRICIIRSVHPEQKFLFDYHKRRRKTLFAYELSKTRFPSVYITKEVSMLKTIRHTVSEISCWPKSVNGISHISGIFYINMLLFKG